MDVSAAGFNSAQANLCPWTLAFHFQDGSHVSHTGEKPVEQALQGQPPRANEIFHSVFQGALTGSLSNVIKRMTQLAFCMTKEIRVYLLNHRELPF